MDILTGFNRCECGEWRRSGRDKELTSRCEKCREEMVDAQQYPYPEETMLAHAGDDD